MKTISKTNKRQYKKPTLKKLGNVSKLTLMSGSGSFDSSGTMRVF